MIKDDEDLRRAVEQVGINLQEIQNYVGRAHNENAKVRFPRGYLRTANDHRERLWFVGDNELKSNLAYTMILSDAVLWLLKRTDITSTARDMLVKLMVFIAGTLIESITKDYLNSVCHKKRSYKFRTEYLRKYNIIQQDLEDELNWIWNTRNKMHLFQLESGELDNNYTWDTHIRCATTYRSLLIALSDFGPITKIKSG